MKENEESNKTTIAVAVFDKYAEFYLEKYIDISSYHESLDIFCESVKTDGAKVLELACGPGNVTKYLINKRKDFNILATDLAPNMLKVAGRVAPEATFQILDCRFVLSLNQKFDGVVSSFGLPYMSKEEVITFINDLPAILNDNAIIYISTMEAKNSNSGWETGSKGDLVYMNYHEAEYLQRALEENKFQIIDVTRIISIEKDDKIITDLIIVAQYNK